MHSVGKIEAPCDPTVTLTVTMAQSEALRLRKTLGPSNIDSSRAFVSQLASRRDGPGISEDDAAAVLMQLVYALYDACEQVTEGL